MGHPLEKVSKKLSVVIPVFNEEGTLGEVLNRLASLQINGWEKEIIVVDDGSSDGTRDILKTYEKEHEVIYHPQNLGKGSAIETGLRKASGDFILIQDADLEYEVCEIPSLVRALEKEPANRTDKVAVYGSRNLYHIKREGMYVPRAGVWLITKEFNFLFDTKLTDLWTCYKLFPRSAIPLFTPGRFESELIFSARLIKNRYKIYEVPISHRPRSVSDGKKIRYRDGLMGIWVLLREYISN